MPRFFNPRTTARPSSKFSHGVVHSTRGRRMVISGQVGVLADGTILPDLESQMDAAWDNLIAVLEEGGMGLNDLIKITAFSTVQGSVATYRSVRDKRLMGHTPASTYLEVLGLARPEFLFEIEGEAVVEDMESIADSMPGSHVMGGISTIRSKDNG